MNFCTYGFSHRKRAGLEQSESNQAILSFDQYINAQFMRSSWWGFPGYQKLVVGTSPVSIHRHCPSCILSVNPIQYQFPPETYENLMNNNWL